MEYKGYRASVSFDSEDDIFVGRVLGISDVIGFHGSSVKELKKAFKESVDDYLEHCKKIGKNPDKEFSGTIYIRTNPDLHRKLSIEAEKLGKSLNEYVVDRLVGSKRA
jgi:predicted HicB family RNase H-like nuclease